jgi:hypothetical protein
MSDSFIEGFEKSAGIKAKLKNMFMSPSNKKRLELIKGHRKGRDLSRGLDRGSKQLGGNPLGANWKADADFHDLAAKELSRKKNKTFQGAVDSVTKKMRNKG